METIHDDQIIVELLDIIILNEFLKKDLILKMKEYISNFEKEAKFDYLKPLAYIDFLNFIQGSENSFSIELKLKQFLFNLELFSVKLYRISEISKKDLNKTELRKLRQAFAHRKSSDILSGKERLVIFGGLVFNFDLFYITNIGEKAQKSETIKYNYRAYIEAILGNYSDSFSGRIKDVKQLRQLNSDLIKDLFSN